MLDDLASPAMDDAALRERLIRFVREIGIEVREATSDTPSFLPGLDIRDGAIILDRAHWLYPGDLLHEAGHLAVAAPEERARPTLSPSPADEMTAIAWSYAAAVHLGVAAAIVFHPHGYRGGGSSLAENFTTGHYFGVPLLQFYGMAIEPSRAVPHGDLPYPHMLHWLR